MKKLLILTTLVVLFHQSTSLKCYTCSVTEDEADTRCVDKPEKLKDGITDCDKKYCIIVRVDYKDPRGKLASMVRNCVDKPTYTNEVIEDQTHRIYYRSCRSDLCNSGSGRAELQNGKGGSLGDKSTIYVPGVRSNGATIVLMTSIFTLLLVGVTLLM